MSITFATTLNTPSSSAITGAALSRRHERQRRAEHDREEHEPDHVGRRSRHRLERIARHERARRTTCTGDSSAVGGAGRLARGIGAVLDQQQIARGRVEARPGTDGIGEEQSQRDGDERNDQAERHRARATRAQPAHVADARDADDERRRRRAGTTVISSARRKSCPTGSATWLDDPRQRRRDPGRACARPRRRAPRRPPGRAGSARAGACGAARARDRRSSRPDRRRLPARKVPCLPFGWRNNMSPNHGRVIQRSAQSESARSPDRTSGRAPDERSAPSDCLSQLRGDSGSPRPAQQPDRPLVPLPGVRRGMAVVGGPLGRRRERDERHTRIGWIGTGVMGISMCGHLMAKGYPTTIYSRTKSRAQGLLDKGRRVGRHAGGVAERIGHHLYDRRAAERRPRGLPAEGWDPRCRHGPAASPST